MIDVRRFGTADKSRWDKFIQTAKNGHFMFKREYMDYHADRFTDHSLLFEKDGKLVAVMPANQSDSSLLSHGGLTFGGIVSDNKMRTALMLDVFAGLNNYAISEGIHKILYKSLPAIYATSPADEDAYALFVNGAKLVRRDVTSAIDYKQNIVYSSQQKSNIKKGRKQGLIVSENNDFSEYWDLLNRVLAARHQVASVHSLTEIAALAIAFPNNIRLFETRDAAGNLMAGSLLYVSENVVHTQYLANSEAGRQIGALDFLIDNLIERFKDHGYFDFGISTTDQGRMLNSGLIRHKEGFGARAIAHDFYELAFQ